VLTCAVSRVWGKFTKHVCPEYYNLRGIPPIRAVPVPPGSEPVAKKQRSLRSRAHGDEGIHSPRSPAGTLDDHRLGAANAYLGLRAGITIAATYPAAVIAMAAMRAWKEISARKKHCPYRGIDRRVRCRRSYLHVARVSSSQGAGRRSAFADAYWKSTALIMVGSILGVLFISLVRRAMVEESRVTLPGIAGGIGDS